MIRLTIDAATWQRILQDHATWFTRAAQHTMTVVNAGHFGNSPAIWSDIKSVLIEFQHNKCAYCERKFSVLNEVMAARAGHSLDVATAYFRIAYAGNTRARSRSCARSKNAWPGRMG